MVKEIRICVEGGGDSKETKASIRRGFGVFLGQLRDIARERCIRWQIIACGPHNAAFDNFLLAHQTHPEAFNVLLVDSESSVGTTPWRHLQQVDGWQTPDISDDYCHLMVQAMEAWLIADRDALIRFYGQRFNPNALPDNEDVEVVTKDDLERSLQSATRNTSKGPYHKLRHGARLLEEIDPDKVRLKARHCNRLFTTIAGRLGTQI